MIAIHDDDVIFGIGDTAGAAYEDAVENGGWDVERFLKSPSTKYSQISPRLAEIVRRDGGSVAFQRYSLGAGHWQVDIPEDDWVDPDQPSVER